MSGDLPISPFASGISSSADMITALSSALVGKPRSPCLSACDNPVQASEGDHSAKVIFKYLQKQSYIHVTRQLRTSEHSTTPQKACTAGQRRTTSNQVDAVLAFDPIYDSKSCSAHAL